MRQTGLRTSMFCLLLIAAISRAEAIEILQFIDSDEYAPYLQDASGLKIADDGVGRGPGTETEGNLAGLRGPVTNEIVRPPCHAPIDGCL